MFIVPRRDLREKLAQVPDPRACQGRRHALTATPSTPLAALPKSNRLRRHVPEIL